jgi:hypothetical protein
MGKTGVNGLVETQSAVAITAASTIWMSRDKMAKGPQLS